MASYMSAGQGLVQLKMEAFPVQKLLSGHVLHILFVVFVHGTASKLPIEQGSVQLKIDAFPLQ